jgi:aryl-alcohol dehydrogenase-like predicted oxidoreductase
LRDLIASGVLRRDEIVVCTKAGYLAFDGAVPADAEQYFVRQYVESGIVEAREVVGGMHCMAPAFLEEQIERSLRNLGLETIDVFYLHNPESQLCEVPVDGVHARLRSAFELLERMVGGKKIRYYGIASWNAFRVPQGERAFLGIAACEALAREAGGAAHHFRFLQLPFNLAMTEAHAAAFQPCGHHMLSALETAGRNGLAVIASASLYQGKLTSNLPCKVGDKLGIGTDAQRALQFTRSAPGILAALAGMANARHVFENIQTAQSQPMPAEQWRELFKGCK